MARKYKKPYKKKLEDDNLTVKKHNRHWRSRRYYQEGHEKALDDMDHRWRVRHPIAALFIKKRKEGESHRTYRYKRRYVSYLCSLTVFLIILIFAVLYAYS